MKKKTLKSIKVKETRRKTVHKNINKNPQKYSTKYQVNITNIMSFVLPILSFKNTFQCIYFFYFHLYSMDFDTFFVLL